MSLYIRKFLSHKIIFFAVFSLFYIQIYISFLTWCSFPFNMCCLKPYPLQKENKDIFGLLFTAKWDCVLFCFNDPTEAVLTTNLCYTTCCHFHHFIKRKWASGNIQIFHLHTTMSFKEMIQWNFVITDIRCSYLTKTTFTARYNLDDKVFPKPP